MAVNEKTSKRVAQIAGTVLAECARIKDRKVPSATCLTVIHATSRIAINLTLTELKALAASVLTQAADKRKK